MGYPKGMIIQKVQRANLTLFDAGVLLITLFISHFELQKLYF